MESTFRERSPIKTVKVTGTRRLLKADADCATEARRVVPPMERPPTQRRQKLGGPSLQVEGAHAEERKLVTVLFADLTGSTALAERLDAEEMRRILAAFFNALSHEILRFGGTVDKYAGDDVMAVFGAPVVHEDDLCVRSTLDQFIRTVERATSAKRTVTRHRSSVMDPDRIRR